MIWPTVLVMSYDEVCLGVTLIYTDFLFFGRCVTGVSVPFLFDFLVFEIFVSRGSYSVQFYLKKYTTKETWYSKLGLSIAVRSN